MAETIENFIVEKRPRRVVEEEIRQRELKQEEEARLAAQKLADEAAGPKWEPTGPCWLVRADMRDPMTSAMGWMTATAVSRIRLTNSFMVECLNHAMYLEAEMPGCPFMMCRIPPRSFGGTLQFLLPKQKSDEAEKEEGESSGDEADDASPGRPKRQNLAKVAGDDPEPQPEKLVFIAPKNITMDFHTKPTPKEKSSDIFFPVQHDKLSQIKKSARLHIFNLCSQVNLGEGIRHVVIDWSALPPPKPFQPSLLDPRARPRPIHAVPLGGCAELECVTVKRVQPGRNGQPRILKFPTAAPNLTTVDIRNGAFPELRELHWLSNCPKFHKFNVARGAFPKLETIGNSFLEGCVALTEMPDAISKGSTSDAKTWIFPELTTINDGWMKGCKGLTVLRIGGIPKLTKIGANCLYNCTNLKECSFDDLPELQEVNDGWMGNCSRLLKFTLDGSVGGGIGKLKKINGRFCSNCTELQVLTLKNLPALEALGGQQNLHNCIELKAIELDNLPALTSVGNQFLSGLEMPKANDVIKFGENVSLAKVSQGSKFVELSRKR